MSVEGQLDEVYERLAKTGPEFEGWLSNHGPMAADALMRIGRAELVDGWLAGYTSRLEPPPQGRWRIREDDWREALGDPSRLGDWTAFFLWQVEERPWQELLADWWQRLLPGGIAGATHALVRTGHAVRALGEAGTAARRSELARALGYWAARWQAVPRQESPAGTAPVDRALHLLPSGPDAGGIRERLGALGREPAWPVAQARLEPVAEVDAVPAALDALVDATVARYSTTAHRNPVMLVHASTAPRAARLALAALPQELWAGTYRQAWSIAAAVTALYAGDGERVAAPVGDIAETEVAEGAGGNGDEHVIKFTEVAIESHRRGNTAALGAARRAQELIGPA